MNVQVTLALEEDEAFEFAGFSLVEPEEATVEHCIRQKLHLSDRDVVTVVIR